MEFCEVCDNLLYFSESSGAAVPALRSLNKFCKNCGFTKQLNIQQTGAIRVAKTLYSEDDLLYAQYKNKYLRHDPTLQRVCDPRVRCSSSSLIRLPTVALYHFLGRR